jgi:hypothetical protein
MVPNVLRKSSGPCAGADDALPNRQRSANDRPHGGTVVPPDRVAVLVLLVPDWCGHPMAIAKREPRPSATPGLKAGPKISIRLGVAGGPCFRAAVSCSLGGGCRMIADDVRAPVYSRIRLPNADHPIIQFAENQQ